MSMKSAFAIDLKNVTYTYPFASSPAVRNLTLQVQPGELVLCTGVSGCGKSTLTRLINGLAPHYFHGDLQGSVHVNFIDNLTRPIFEISREVGTLFQDPEHQFFALNVEDELAFAHEWRNTPPEWIAKSLHPVIHRFGIDGLLDASVHELSEGQKQKVALAGVLSLAPNILVLDEPTANLDPESTLELAQILGQLKREGITIVVVDHRLYWLRDIADRVVIMQDGTVARETTFTALNSLDIRERYGLREIEVCDVRAGLTPVPLLPSDRGLCVSHIDFGYRQRGKLFENFTATFPLGAVIGLLGANGTGKTTLARLLTGLEKISAGSVAFDAQVIEPKKLLRIASLVLQNTDHQLHMKSVRQELEASAVEIPLPQREEAVKQTLEQYSIAHLEHRHPQSLSGGEKQRLVIACATIRNPRLLILDEPTSGLDGRNLDSIARNIRLFASKGCCVLLISHDLELLEQVCTHRLTLQSAL